MSESIAAFFLRHDAARLPELLPLRYHRMQADALAFFRGSAPLYYARFGAEALLRASPAAWLCGDAHVENFGSYRGDNGLVYFDLNDFDEALRGPLLWDAGRLLVSVLLAAGHFALPPVERQAVGRELLAAYAGALAGGKAFLLERSTATGVVHQLLKNVAHRRQRDLLAGRVGRRGGWHLRHTALLHPLPPDERAAVLAAFEAWCALQPAPVCGSLLDVAQRVAGVGSLGVPRYAVLAHHRHPHKLPVLLDLKLAAPAAAACPDVPQPEWPSDAHRVVQAQTWLQAVPPALLQPLYLRGQPFVLRALQPVADKLDFDHFTHSEAAFRAALPDFGRLLAWAHLRAAGHRGAAGPDELQAFGAAYAADWAEPLLRFATHAVAQVREDYHDFRAACRAAALPTCPTAQELA